MASSALDHARLENRVLAEMGALAASHHDYADVVEDLLDLVEQVVSSPFLSLAVQEVGRIGHYARAGVDVDPVWAAEIERHAAETHRQRLGHPVPSARHVAVHRLQAPAAWLVTFPAETRSGRTGALTLGSSGPLSIAADEEQVMLRVAHQALLVLDHALLLQQLEALQLSDGLTGAANHRRLLEFLDYELKRHRHSDRWLALLLLDVEGLGAINRAYGRHYGNHILRTLTDLLQEEARPIDVVARLGQDELAMVLPETDEEEANEISERLRERVLAMQFAGGVVNVSVGVLHVKPDETLTAEGFLRRGEQTLEEVKRQDRGWRALLQPGSRQRV